MDKYTMSPEERLKAAGFNLPPPLSTTNLFRPTVRDGNLIFVSGHVPKDRDRFIHLGRIGETITPDDARPIVAGVVCSCLASMKSEIGELSRVRRVLKMVGFFAAGPEFTGHSALLNAGSEVLVTAFGEAGAHARSAIGVASLPHGSVIEIEMVVAIHE